FSRDWSSDVCSSDLRRDGVDVTGLGQRRETDVEHPGALQQLVQDETGALGTGDPDQLVEGLDPLLGLLGVDIRKLVLELVEDIVHFRVSHAFILGGGGLEVTLKNPGRVRAGLILAAAVAIVLAAFNLTRPTAPTTQPTPPPSSAGTVAVAQPLAAAES